MKEEFWDKLKKELGNLTEEEFQAEIHKAVKKYSTTPPIHSADQNRKIIKTMLFPEPSTPQTGRTYTEGDLQNFFSFGRLAETNGLSFLIHLGNYDEFLKLQKSKP